MKLLPFLLVIFGFIYGKSSSLSVGSPAPDFKLLDQDEKHVTLGDFKGKWVIVYFYPKDDTPGCTKEACGIRDDFGQFEKDSIEVLGISYDTPESHRKFREKYQLPFTLLSDTDKNVSKLYDSKGLIFPSRKTFIIDPEGILRKIYDKVNVTSHSTSILADVKKLSE